VLSGSFGAPVNTGGSVVVNLSTVPPPPPETATNGERIRFITAAVMHLQAVFVEDREERVARQRETDAHRSRIDARLSRSEMIYALLGALMALTALSQVAIVAWVVTR
jgi:hypothetical protein